MGIGLSISKSIVEATRGQLIAKEAPVTISIRNCFAFGGRSTMKEAETAPRPTVFVVDDDQPVREALTLLFQSVGLQARAFASADEFLKVKLPNAPCCLVLDVRLPGLSGLDFQNELAKANIHIPVVFMTGHGDIPMTVKAMKAGAIEFLTKPFRDQELLDAVQMGLERARVEQENDKPCGCQDRLSP
jgi:FixJ family two-component response regulator